MKRDLLSDCYGVVRHQGNSKTPSTDLGLSRRAPEAEPFAVCCLQTKTALCSWRCLGEVLGLAVKLNASLLSLKYKSLERRVLEKKKNLI